MVGDILDERQIIIYPLYDGHLSVRRTSLSVVLSDGLGSPSYGKTYGKKLSAGRLTAMSRPEPSFSAPCLPAVANAATSPRDPVGDP